jgi:hypothetical protein
MSNFPNKFGPIAASRCEEIDRIGTIIWNICTRLRREFDTDEPKDIPIILLLARVFSFLLLGGAYDGGRSAPGNLGRLMKIGIKAGKSCIGLWKWVDETYMLMLSQKGKSLVWL